MELVLLFIIGVMVFAISTLGTVGALIIERRERLEAQRLRHPSSETPTLRVVSDKEATG